MEIVIDIDASVPLFAQLIEQIKKAVLSDQISPGDPLPSIRQLANDLDVNNKTVAKAFLNAVEDGDLQDALAKPAVALAKEGIEMSRRIQTQELRP